VRESLIIGMMNLQVGATQFVYVTLKETQTLTSPNYLFRFVQRTTNAEVKFVKLNNTDVSAYKDRTSKFQFVVNTLFPSAEIGEYYYYIYEQASTTNTNIANTGKLLETGMMRMNPAAADVYGFTKYQTNNVFVTK
jgi:hypothetical protein